MGEDGASSGPRYLPEYVSLPGEDDATRAMAKRVGLSLNKRCFDDGGRGSGGGKGGEDAEGVCTSCWGRAS